MKDLEFYSFTANGNGDRFYDAYAGQVLLSSFGKQKVFYTVRPDGRWERNEGRGAGDVERRARDLLEKMRERAKYLSLEADVKEDDELRDLGKSLMKWTTACDHLPAMKMMAETACLTYGMVCNADEEFDARMDLLGTPDGVMELGAGEITLREISPADMITMSTGVSWKPKMLAEGEPVPPLLQEYFDTFIPEPDKRRALFKALGSALLGGNTGRLMVILQGKSGTNGKTQLVEALRAALGDYAMVGNPSIFRGNLDDRARPDILGLMKTRVAFLAEASKNWELHGDRVKLITGGDGLPVRKMYENKFTQELPHFTPVVYTNDMPRINGADPALKRRMLVIDFNHQPVKEDPSVKSRFLACQETREYLFAMLVAGLQAALLEGLEDVKDMFAMNTVTAFDETTHLGEFFEWLNDSGQLQTLDVVEMSAYGIKSKYMSVKSFHERYVYWVKEHGNKQDKNDGMNYREFNASLRTMYGWESENIAGLRWVGRILKDSVAWTAS